MAHPEELHQVEAGAHKRPLALRGSQPPAHEPKEIEVPLDLSKDRFDGLAPQFVGLTALPGRELSLHPLPWGGVFRDPAFGSPLCFTGFPLFVVFLGCDHKLGAFLFDGRHVQIVAPVAGIGPQGSDGLLDPRLLDRSPGLLDHGLELVQIILILGYHCGDDDLVFGACCKTVNIFMVFVSNMCYCVSALM